MHKTRRVPLRGRRGVRARLGLFIIPINHSSQSFPPFHQYLARHSRHALAAELVTKHMFTPALRRKLERMKQDQLALRLLSLYRGWPKLTWRGSVLGCSPLKTHQAAHWSVKPPASCRGLHNVLNNLTKMTASRFGFTDPMKAALANSDDRFSTPRPTDEEAGNEHHDDTPRMPRLTASKKLFNNVTKMTTSPFGLTAFPACRRGRY